MASRFASKPPVWFTVVRVLFVLWALMGCASLYMHFAVGPGPDASEYDRNLFNAMPMWLNLVYIGAVGFGALATLGLCLGRRWAVPLSMTALVLVLVQFGWMFLATDIIAVKGTWVTYFPAFIVIMQVIQLFVANKAKARGWLR